MAAAASLLWFRSHKGHAVALAMCPTTAVFAFCAVIWRLASELAAMAACEEPPSPRTFYPTSLCLLAFCHCTALPSLSCCCRVPCYRSSSPAPCCRLAPLPSLTSTRLLTFVASAPNLPDQTDTGSSASLATYAPPTLSGRQAAGNSRRRSKCALSGGSRGHGKHHTHTHTQPDRSDR